jgi:hypothetical protein
MEHKRKSGSFPDFPDQKIWEKSGFKFTSFDISKPKEEEIPVKEVEAKDAKKKPEAKKSDKKGKDDVFKYNIGRR